VQKKHFITKGTSTSRRTVTPVKRIIHEWYSGDCSTSWQVSTAPH